MDVCIVKKKNLGLSKCLQMPGYLKGFIETPESFKLTEADRATPTALKDALQALLVAPEGERGYYYPLSKLTENLSTEAAYEESPVAVMPVDDGQYRFKFHIRENLCLHKAMYSHRASNGRFIPVDKNNNLIMTEDETTGDAYGLHFSMLHTEKFRWTDGSGQATTSPVYIVVEDNLELDASGLLIEAKIVNQLARLTDVDLTIVGSPSATTIVVDVKQHCDGTPVNGLVIGDFVLLTAGGAPQTITALAEVNGRYTLSGVGLVTGTLNLDTPDSLSIKAYESTGAVVVTVV